MGVRSVTTDGYDRDWDQPDTVLDAGYAAVFHNGEDSGWDGPTDFYRTDYRAPMAPGDSKTWAPIHLWADPYSYGQETMFLSVEPFAGNQPPSDRTYTIELLYVPDGIDGAPPVGTTWPVDKSLVTIEVPTFATYDGMEGYRFSFTASAVPEPAALPGMLLPVALLRRRY
jgi:hypothetical protein